MINVAFVLDAAAFRDTYGDECLRAIEPIARLLAAPLTASQFVETSPQWMSEVEVLFTGWGGPRLDRELLERMPRLRTVLYGGGSIRPIASDALWNREIAVSSAAALNALPVVEYTFGAILLSFKRAWHHARFVRESRSYEPLRSLPISTGWGATIGLVSLGLIGAGVAERLRSCDVRVIAYDPVVDDDRFAQLGAERVSLEKLFSESDVVSLHTPLLTETEGMIDAALLARMKPHATFINTARGAIVDQDALLKFLAARPDVQAIIDVTDPEPPAAHSAFYDLPNVFLTPHIAGSIGAECRRMGRALVQELHRLARGEALQLAVAREQLGRIA